MTWPRVHLVGNKSITLTIGTLALTMVIAISAQFAAKGWLYAFLKLEQIRIPYILFFSGFLVLGLWIVFQISRPSPIKQFLLGAVIGQVAGTIALICANFFIPNGVERNLKSFSREGFFNVLLIDTSVAFIVGGWLFGAIIFLVYGWLIENYQLGRLG